MEMDEIGELLEIQKKYGQIQFNWKIPESFSRGEMSYISPSFLFLNRSMNLGIALTREYIVFDLIPQTELEESCKIICEFAMKRADSSILCCSFIYYEDYEFDAGAAFDIVEFYRHMHDFIVNGVLTIMCKLNDYSDFSYGLKEIGLDNLTKNIYSSLNKDEFCDAKFLCKDIQFNAHKVIVAARSKVLADIFKLTDKDEPCEIPIDDCDPDTFQDFLKYLYCCELEIVSARKALQLYKTANKYQVEELKLSCIEKINENMEVQDFFEIIADKDDELIAAAHVFFDKNLEEILHSDQWKSLLINDTNLANIFFLEMAAKKRRIDSGSS